MNRRAFLATGAAKVGLLAGCQSLSGTPSEKTPQSTADTNTETTTGNPRTDTNTETTTGNPRTETTTEQARPTSFVERNGTEFVLNGERYVFTGTANCCVANRITGRFPADTVLDIAARLNVDVVRFKIGDAGGPSNCGDEVNSRCHLNYQPEPGEYNEAAFRHLDYVISEAGRRGLRVILPLLDNWRSDGMNRYVRWSETARTHADFYTDQRTRELYRNYVRHLLTRTNTITGREYRNDPTILLLELTNELRLSEPAIDEHASPDQTDYEGFLSWVEEMASFVSDIDTNHLISTGSDKVNTVDMEPSLTGSGKGYRDIHAIDGIDAATFHLWPQNWGVDEQNAVETGQEYITERTRTSKESLGKPVYLGEYGWWVDMESDTVDEELQQRQQTFSRWQNTMVSADIDGAIHWEVGPTQGSRGQQRELGHSFVSNFEVDPGTCSQLQSFADRFDNRLTD